MSNHRITTALSLALASGLALGACRRTPPVDPSENTLPTEPSEPEPTIEALPVSGLVGGEADPSALCAPAVLLDQLQPARPVDSITLRTSFRPAPDAGPGQDVAQIGTLCATSSDPPDCMSKVTAMSPEESGWGYCGMGCSNSGLVTTSRNGVEMFDSPAEIATFLGDINVPAEALLLAIANDYTPECDSAVQDGDVWTMNATILVSDCPMTHERRLISVDGAGAVTVVQMIESTSSSICAGRRPDGMLTANGGCDDAVSAHLAALAHLEAAAVIAFERLAMDLERLQAPAALVARARAAALDEVDHAERMGALAGEHGAVVPPVDVSEHVIRPVFDIALENAVEGCVRETYGVVDALYRSRLAPNPAIRALFAKIAEDEARHAALSWDVAAWLEGHLSDSQRAEIRLACKHAHASLRQALGQGTVDAVQQQLGAPSSQAAVAMAESLEQHLEYGGAAPIGTVRAGVWG